MLGMLDYERQSLDAKKSMVTRMGYPMVGIGVNYTLINKSEMSASSMNGKDMIMPMLTVTIPIYRKKYKAMQTETILLKSSVDQGYQSASNSLQTEYYEALQMYQDSKRRIKLYENQMQLSKQSLNITINNYSTGCSDLVEVLQNQRQTFEYEFRQVEALTDYNTAIAWLKKILYCTQVQ